MVDKTAEAYEQGFENGAEAMRTAVVAKIQELIELYAGVAQPNNGSYIAKQTLGYARRELEKVEVTNG